MTQSLPAPRRKARVRETAGAALPLPSALPHLPFTHYQATYSQGHIYVSDPRQAEALWHNGYFGHGTTANRNGKQRVKKRWKLVETCGLKDANWFKEQEQSRKNCVMDEDMGEEEEEEDKQDKDEEEGTESTRTGIWKDEKGSEVNEDEIEPKERCRKEREEESVKDELNAYIMEGCNSKPWETVLMLPKDQGTLTQTDEHPYLSLLPEEALFLSYALGCLVLTYSHPPASTERRKRALVEQRTHEMTIDEIWRVFTSEDPTFAMKYAAFHHFRTQGWVVKDGLKYGVDYVLYPVGPPFYHSQYAVKIHSVWSDTLQLSQSAPGHLNWTTIATMERLANHVNKTPILCFVLRPRSLTQSRLDLIESLAELKVQEVVLGRWSPSDGSG